MPPLPLLPKTHSLRICIAGLRLPHKALLSGNGQPICSSISSIVHKQPIIQREAWNWIRQVQRYMAVFFSGTTKKTKNLSLHAVCTFPFDFGKHHLLNTSSLLASSPRSAQVRPLVFRKKPTHRFEGSTCPW